METGGRSMKERIVNKMIDFYKGNRSDVRHFLKVYAYAQTIGRLEDLDEKTQDTLEIAAILPVRSAGRSTGIQTGIIRRRKAEIC